MDVTQLAARQSVVLAAEEVHNPLLPVWSEVILSLIVFAILFFIVRKYVVPNFEKAFAELRVWDTAGNNGVLLYVLLADHAIEIVADRSAAAALGQQTMQQACDRLREAFIDGRHEQGMLDALDVLHAELARAFPVDPRARDVDELPNRPAIL